MIKYYVLLIELVIASVNKTKVVLQKIVNYTFN